MKVIFNLEMQNQENFPRHDFREAIDLSSAKRRWVRNLKLVNSVLERKGQAVLLRVVLRW